MSITGNALKERTERRGQERGKKERGRGMWQRRRAEGREDERYVEA